MKFFLVLTLLAGIACASDDSERNANLNLEIPNDNPLDSNHGLEKRDADARQYDNSAVQKGGWATFSPFGPKRPASKKIGSGAASTSSFMSGAASTSSFSSVRAPPKFNALLPRYYRNSLGFSRYRADYFRKYGRNPSATSFYDKYNDIFQNRFMRRFGSLSNLQIYQRFGHLSPSEFFGRYGFYPIRGYNSRFGLLSKRYW